MGDGGYEGGRDGVRKGSVDKKSNSRHWPRICHFDEKGRATRVGGERMTRLTSGQYF